MAVAGRTVRGAVAGWFAGCVTLALLCEPVAAAELERSEMLRFLAQCLRTAPDGQPRLTRPGEAGCPDAQVQRVDSPARWRKHDWGSTDDPASLPLGYQVSDSALDRRGGRDLSVQIFDFGDGERRFGRFDKGRGDGGDLLALVGDRVYGVLTEDGGNGLQWFVGEGCRTGEPEGRLRSWLFFGADVRRDAWTETTAGLNIARSPAECPRVFGHAFTRYRRASIDVPFRVTDRAGGRRARTSPVDTIVSEHFDRDTVGASVALERFYFGRDLGKYRWEAWVRREGSPVRDAPGDAARLAASGRCVPLPFSAPPAEDYVMVDCRTWTNLVWQARPWTVARFGWPDVEPFGASD